MKFDLVHFLSFENDRNVTAEAHQVSMDYSIFRIKLLKSITFWASPTVIHKPVVLLYIYARQASGRS